MHGTSDLILNDVPFIVYRTSNFFMDITAPIGIFDSGYGGLTVFKEIRKLLPEYDFLYLGDNARSPYGSRSFEVIHEFTLEAVQWLFNQGCNLVILACNTASAKALRTIQQRDLARIAPYKRVLGVIRPTTEMIGNISRSRHIGILGTQGTIASESYTIEIKKFFPDIQVTGEACSMWVALVENGQHNTPGADYFIKQNLENIFKKDSEIDTLILACTHYPLLEDRIRTFLPKHIQLISQGPYVALSLKDYLLRHPEIDEKCSKNGISRFVTTESEEKFMNMASVFLNGEIRAQKIELR